MYPGYTGAFWGIIGERLLKRAFFCDFSLKKTPFLTTKVGFESLIVQRRSIIRTTFVGFTPVNSSDHFFLLTTLNNQDKPKAKQLPRYSAFFARNRLIDKFIINKNSLNNQDPKFSFIILSNSSAELIYSVSPFTLRVKIQSRLILRLISFVCKIPFLINS